MLKLDRSEIVIMCGQDLYAMDISSGIDQSVLVYARVCSDGSIQVMGCDELTEEEVRRYAEALSHKRSPSLPQLLSRRYNSHRTKLSQQSNATHDGLRNSVRNVFTKTKRRKRGSGWPWKR